MSYLNDPLNESLHSFERYFRYENELINQQKPNFKQTKKITLYEIPQINSYNKLDRPILDQQKKKLILQKLKMEKQSFSAFKQRQKINDFFVNYGFNPFLNLQGKSKKQRGQVINGVQIKLKDQQLAAKKRKTQNIVQPQKAKQQQLPQFPQAVSDLKVKPFKNQIYQNQYYFNDYMQRHQTFSRKNLQSVANKKGFELFQNKKVDLQSVFSKLFTIGTQKAKQKKMSKILQEIDNKKQNRGVRQRRETQSSIKQPSKQQTFNPILKRLPEDILPLDKILEIQQLNFFYQYPKKKQLNIFEIAHQLQSAPLIGKDLLQKQCFQFNSIVQKATIMKIATYRDISRLSRQVILDVKKPNGNIFDYMDSNDLGFKISQLRFHDIMSVASGRFNTQFVIRIFNQDFDGLNQNGKENSQTSSQQQDVEIFYQENTANLGIKYFNDNQSHQISTYLKIPPVDHQIQAEIVYDNYKKQIDKNFKLKQKLLSQTIVDKSLHSQINKDIKFKMHNFLGVDQKLDQDIDKIIRFNKSKKDKKQSLKVNKVLEMFNNKKQHQILKQKAGMIQQQIYQNPDFMNRLTQTQPIIPQLNSTKSRKSNNDKLPISTKNSDTKTNIKINKNMLKQKSLKLTQKTKNTTNKKVNDLNVTISSISPVSKVVNQIKNQPLTTQNYRYPSYKNFTPTNCDGSMTVREKSSKTPTNIQKSGFTPKNIKSTKNNQFKNQINDKQNRLSPLFTTNSPFFRKKIKKDDQNKKNGQKSLKKLPNSIFSYNGGKNNYMNTISKNKY